ncbi:uncharacterized protein K02A2.6-like [Photinus pyralis]|uniref:uncharacterized protein K02A2.6-like n=1 Tax=Photinus pyralis TaxID=7054 RepID=UPI00126736EC|nr:uncharacterized protein K02A2.6-like [Photinus pyralis]
MEGMEAMQLAMTRMAEAIAALAQNQHQPNQNLQSEEPLQRPQDRRRRKFTTLMEKVHLGLLQLTCKKPLEFELDTGCEYTIVPVSVFQTLRTDLKKSDKLFQPYGTSATIPALGMSTVKVRYKHKKLHLDIYVVQDPAVSILGGEWLHKLGIYIPVNHVYQVKAGQQYMKDLESEFQDVFAEGIGCAHKSVSIKFKDNAKPVFMKHRSVPYALKDKIETELDRMVKDGILMPVEHSQWATPIVPVVTKDSVRITADYSCTVNPQLEVPSYPLPKIEEQLAKISNGRLFCKLDITKAYWCLPVDEASAAALTINTHKAPVIWTKFIEEVISGIEGLGGYFDDLVVSANDVITLKSRLSEVLRRLQANGLRLNLQKCSFFVDSVTYLGHEISAAGIRPAKDGLQAIQELPPPANESELKKFLGMVSFYSKFVPGMASTVAPLVAPLYNATKQAVPWKWTRECATAFQTLKQQLTSDHVLVSYNPQLPIVLSCDASPEGLEAVLAHQYPDGSDRLILYIHRKLDNCQVKYSQIDKESLAIKWAVEKLNIYLVGRQFTLITDHAPLIHIFGVRRKKLPTLCATRLLHYAIFLQDFSFTIKYRKSEEHGNADFLSRLPQHSSDLRQAPTSDDPDDLVQLHHISLLPMTHQSIAQHTQRDIQWREWLQKLRSGETLGENEDGLYSLQSGCVMRGLRTYIPSACRPAVLEELHTGHLGISKTKALARGYAFWPKMQNACRH